MDRSAAQEKALRVIFEIIRNSPGRKLQVRGRLFKAFYFAHLFYARQSPVPLTDWPIVHMPNGPGIDDAEQLLEELVRRGWITRERILVGPYQSEEYRAAEALQLPPLDAAEQEAIIEAVRMIQNKTASELSELVHEYSRSWQTADKGAVLDIYLDLISDEDFDRRRQELKRLGEVFKE